MPKQETTILDEINLAVTNYAEGIHDLPIVHPSRDVAMLARAGVKHTAKINTGAYGFDTLLLESAYLGLSSDDAEEARAHLVNVAAIAATIVAYIDSPIPEVEEDEAPAEDEADEEPASDDEADENTEDE